MALRPSECHFFFGQAIDRSGRRLMDRLTFYGLYMVIVWLMMVNNNLVGGIPTPLKNMKVSWGYYSQYMETNVPNHQPEIVHSLEDS